MSVTIEATYEHGFLKLSHPLPLAEHELVQITVHSDKVGPTGTSPKQCFDSIPPEQPSAAAHRDSAAPAEAYRIVDEGEMLNIWLNVPASPDARTVIVRRGPLPFPDPPVITDDENA